MSFKAFKTSIAFKSSAKIPLVGASQTEIEAYKNKELEIKKTYIENILKFCLKEINKLTLLDAMHNCKICDLTSCEFESFTSTKFLWNFTENEFRYIVRCIQTFLQNIIREKYETLSIKLTITHFGEGANFRTVRSRTNLAPKIDSISYDNISTKDESPCPTETESMVSYILQNHDFKIKL